MKTLKTLIILPLLMLSSCALFKKFNGFNARTDEEVFSLLKRGMNRSEVQKLMGLRYGGSYVQEGNLGLEEFDNGKIVYKNDVVVWWGHNFLVPGYSVNIDGFNIKQVPALKKAFILLADTSENKQLMYSEVKHLIEKALLENDYKLVNNVGSANIIIRVDFNASPPDVQEKVTSRPLGYFNPVTFQYVYMGQNTDTTREINYNLSYEISAIESDGLKNNANTDYFWKTIVIYRSEKNNIRSVLPALIFHSSRHIEKKLERVEVYSYGYSSDFDLFIEWENLI